MLVFRMLFCRTMRGMIYCRFRYMARVVFCGVMCMIRVLFMAVIVFHRAASFPLVICIVIVSAFKNNNSSVLPAAGVIKKTRPVRRVFCQKCA